MQPLTPNVGITAGAWETLCQQVASTTDGLETGGILLGHDTGDQVTITVAGDPGPNAYRTPDRFLRDREHAAALAATAWEHERAQWIGEWHTHPNSPPVPSDVDLDSYAAHLADPDLGFVHFISVIVGRGPRRETACATWLITPQRAQLLPLTLPEDAHP